MSKETDAVERALALAMVDYVWIKGLITDEEKIKIKAQLLKEFGETKNDGTEGKIDKK